MVIVINLTSADCVVTSWIKSMPCIIMGGGSALKEEVALFCEKIKMFALSNRNAKITVKFKFLSITLANINNVPFDWVDCSVSK